MLKKIFRKKPDVSASALWLITLYLIWNTACVREPRVSSWDALGYYLYLPQTFIEHDPGNYSLDPLQKARVQYDLSPWLYQVHPTPKGNHVSQYPIGMACFYLPGFLTGHGLAYLLGYEADGYSPPYQYSQVYLNVIYCLLSLWLLRKLLLRYFSNGVSALLLLIVFFGTNYFVYANGGYGMPHTYLFLGYVLVIWLTIRWHEHHTFKNSVLLGFICGLMTICRPTEILVLLIPLLWQVGSLRDLKNKVVLLTLVRTRYLLYFTAAFLFLPMVQLCYWRLYTGEFFHYSYANPGESFEFLHPHLTEYLFSFRKGWFLYTPLMFPAVLFLLLGGHRKKEYWLPFAVFTCVNVYVLASWSNWWYATSFGQRSVVQSYPLYLFGLGYLYEKIKARKKILVPALVTTAALIALNLFQVWQYNHGIIDAGRMTRDYYLASFGKTEKPQGADSLLLVDRSLTLSDTLPHAQRYKHTQTFVMPMDSAGTFKVAAKDLNGKKIFKLPYTAITDKDHAWIEVSFDIMALDSIKLDELTMGACFLNKRNLAYAWMFMKVFEHAHALGDGWAHFTAYYLTPELRLKSDRFNGQLDKFEGGEYLVRHFKLRIFEPKVSH